MPTRQTRRRWLARIALLLALVWLMVGPWPIVERDPAPVSWVVSATADEAMQLSSGDGRTVLLAGFAQVDITPAPGAPLAGYSARRPNQSSGIHHPVHARALTLANDYEAITLLHADVLLIPEDIVLAVVKRTGLARHQLYITATHTHNGPGSIARPLPHQIVFGRYDPLARDRLIDQLAQVVEQSRAQRVPVQPMHALADGSAWVQNRIDPAKRPDEAIHILALRRVGGDATDQSWFALLVSYAAHATVLPRTSLVISPDYPGSLCDAVQQRTGAAGVLFAAGAVGDARPVPPHADTPADQADAMGAGIADAVLDSLHHAQPIEHAHHLAAQTIAVELPPLRIMLHRHARLSPFATAWVADRTTTVQHLRLGHLHLVGMPGDVGSDLAHSLRQHLPDHHTLIVTSFSGDYRGYLHTADTIHAHHTYETTSMNFHGPHLGHHLLHALRTRIAKQPPLRR